MIRSATLTLLSLPLVFCSSAWAQQAGGGAAGGGIGGGIGQAAVGLTQFNQTGTIERVDAIDRNETGFVGGRTGTHPRSTSGIQIQATNSQFTPTTTAVGGLGGVGGIGGRGGVGGITGVGNIGNTGFGNAGFGNTGLGRGGIGGQGAFGNTGRGGFGNTGFGNTGFGNTGFGNTGFGAQNTQNQGFVRVQVVYSPSIGQSSIPARTSSVVASGLQTRLSRIPRITPTVPIRVSIEDGKTVLRGTVKTAGEKDLMERLAQLEPGVFEVSNLIQVAAPSQPSASTAN